jgi:glyoxylase-like metal-dependent hydrolase (beta-lactamase superfamily II)
VSDWIIEPLYFGFTDGETPGGNICSIPWMGFFLTDGKHKVLCDTGVKTGFFRDSKSPWGFHAEGDEGFVLRALEKIGVAPDSIEMVIYTHFHWDHAGNCHLFPKAVHVFQDEEWKELIDPLPSMAYYGLHDPRVIPEFGKLRCRRVSGDLAVFEGLDLIHTPGHSAGHQCLRVRTARGVYIIAGDLVCVHYMAYPNINMWQKRDGSVVAIDRDMDRFIHNIFFSPIFDHYAWYRAQYRILGMIEGPEYLIPGHEPTILNTERFG